MKTLTLFFVSLIAYAQVQTPLTVLPGAGTAPGSIRLRERRSNGTNYFALKASPSMASDVEIQAPPDYPATNGECLTATTAGVMSWEGCMADRLVSNYDWSSTVGTVSAGTLTVTFTSNCPADGSDTTYKFLVTGTAPSTEVVTSDGSGTCTVGGSGTIKGTLAGGHTAATAQSASDGWQEAIYSVADTGVVRVRAAVGTYNIYSDILTGARSVTIQCDGPGSLLVPQTNNIAVFNAAAPTGIRVDGCAINNTASKTGVTGIKTYNPTGDSFGTAIRDVQIEGVATCVHLGTVYAISDFSHNRLFQCSSKALWLEQVSTGDAGTGLIGPNNLFSDSLGAQYGILWNGPGNVKIQGNSFNGYVEQIHMEPTMGTVNVSGTAVTWVSGHKFRASMAGFGLAASSTVFATIASVTDDQNIVLATSQPTCTGCSYYVGITGQMQIMNNTMDGGAATTHNIRLSGDIPFFNFQIDGNFATAYTVSNNKSITVDGAGYRFGSIKHNNLQTSTVGTTIGVDVSAGGSIDVHDNQIVNQKTGVAIGASAITVTSDGNRCTDTTNTTDCLTSASATTVARELNSVTFAQLTALSAANGSTMYCSNCQQTSSTDATCATGGTGLPASRVNGAWKCVSGEGDGLWSESSGNAYRPTGNVGIGTSSPIVKLHVKGTAGAANLLLEDQTGNGVLNVFSENGYSFAGTGTATDFLLGSDNASRWRITSTGMLRPELDNTYDFGLTGTRPRVVYGHGGDFSPSGTGGYLRARKFEMTDRLGGAGFWDASAGANAAGSSDLKIRDNAGSRALLLERAVGGVASNRLFAFGDWLPAQRATADGDAVNDSVNPSLGGTSNRWEKAWANDADFADDVVIGDSLNVTGQVVVPNSVTPGLDGISTLGSSSVYFGSAYLQSLFTGEVRPRSTATYSLGATGNRYIRGFFSGGITASGPSYIETGGELVLRTGTTFTIDDCTTSGHVLTAGASGVMTCQAAPSGGPFADTTAIVKGSADATKLARFEVDGLTTGTTRVLTVQDTNYTLASVDTAQTFTGANTFSAGQTFNGGNSYNANQTFSGDIRFGADNTYNIGVTGTRPTHIFTRSFSMSASGFISSGATMNVQSGGTLDINSGGTLSANGTAGSSTTRTVRASGGGSDCTLVFTNGILTGGTC